ncbi:MAG: AMP-binding protein, partial [Planctomycetota bacterium]
MSHPATVSDREVVEELIPFCDLFDRQVERTPDTVAVVHEDKQWSYRELQADSLQWAAQLLKTGIRPEQRIGLCVDRSGEAIAAMFGILRAGAAFVPLDPEYPAERLAYMVQDAAIETIIADPRYQQQFADEFASLTTEESPETHITWFSDTAASQASVDIAEARDIVRNAETAKQLRPDSLAYIMYTSGSTGRPKGVQIEHAALAAYCFADIDVYRLTENDRTLQFSTLNFDIAIEEIFPPLLTGGVVVVRPREREADSIELSSLVQRYQITAIHLATAYWHQWVDLMMAAERSVPESIRLMIVTGEKVSVAHYRRWQSICDHEVLWCNAYGPTEATVSATVFVPDDSFDAPNMPIGRPLKRYTAHILDNDLQPVGAQETGQLFIG